jgi:hypothetical protein
VARGTMTGGYKHGKSRLVTMSRGGERAGEIERLVGVAGDPYARLCHLRARSRLTPALCFTSRQKDRKNPVEKNRLTN